MNDLLPSNWKEIAGIIGFALMIFGSAPYIFSTIKGETKPHIFSWLIWHLVDDIAVATQWVGGAKHGIWATAAGAMASFIVLLLAFRKRHDVAITRFDKVTFVIALCAIPMWMLTKDPLPAAVIATAINASAFLIALRKVARDPKSEDVSAYAIYSLGWVFGIAALDSFTLTTTLYPAVGLLMNFTVFMAILHFRRASLR